MLLVGALLANPLRAVFRKELPPNYADAQEVAWKYLDEWLQKNKHLAERGKRSIVMPLVTLRQMWENAFMLGIDYERHRKEK
jgi:hypothetical protein